MGQSGSAQGLATVMKSGFTNSLNVFSTLLKIHQSKETVTVRCELCDLPIDQCVHGLAEQRRKAAVSALVRVSPTHTAHLDGCPHKGDDDDYTGWGEITQPGSWLHLCKTVPPEYTGEKVVADLTTNIR